MPKRKTVETDADAAAFLQAVPNTTRREDAAAVADIMAQVSGERARMWGPSIVGFGRHSYALAGGQTSEICRIGFSPRAQSLVFYLGDFDGRQKLLTRLGKHRLGSGCLYINKLSDIDIAVLEEMIERSWRHRGPGAL
ncbi:MAG: DUF1801 domain-containing protein [Pseudomonadales bacterium]